MKSSLTILIALFILIVGTNGFTEEIVHLTTGEFPPYTSKKLDHFGVANRIIAEAFALEGYQVKFSFFPWKRAYQEAASGEFAGSSYWAKTTERVEQCYFSNPIWEDGWVFFHLKSYPFKWESFNDLKGIPIGGTLEYSYGENFYKAEKEGIIKIQWVPMDILNYRKLKLGRIKIFPNVKIVGYYDLKNNFPPEEFRLFTHHPKQWNVSTNHLVMSKKLEKSKYLMEIFNRGLKRLRESGKVDQYLTEFEK